MLPVILHIPHASTAIPEECLGDFVIDREGRAKHLAASTDHFTDELFAMAGPGVSTVAFPISRLVVDPERFEDDAHEPMAARGLGVLYECGHDGQRIRRPIEPLRRAWYLDRWYRPHHAALESSVDRAIQHSGHVLLVDCHSYPDVPLAVDLDQSTPRPDGCFGTSGIHTPPWLLEAGVRCASAQGWKFGVDQPYAGSIVPMRHFGKDARVLSIMIEVNRNRYMSLEGDTAVKSSGFGATRRFVHELIAALRSAAGRLGSHLEEGPETEEGSERYEALRRLKVRRTYEAQLMRSRAMQKPVISFQDEVDLPFMNDIYPEDDDGDSAPDHEKILNQMGAAIPKLAIKLGVVERDLDHSPGLTWRVEEHYYVLQLQGQKHDWVLFRIRWDDDDGRYEWSQVAVGSGFPDGKAAGRAMAAAFFKECDFDLADDDYAHYREFLELL